jgi:hypothetical protein
MRSQEKAVPLVPPPQRSGSISAKTPQMSICLRRREFIAGLGGAAVWPLAARTQQRPIPTLRFLSPQGGILIVQSPGYCLMGTMSWLFVYVGFASRREVVVDPKLRYAVAGICHATGECAIAE